MSNFEFQRNAQTLLDQRFSQTTTQLELNRELIDLFSVDLPKLPYLSQHDFELNFHERLMRLVDCVNSIDHIQKDIQFELENGMFGWLKDYFQYGYYGEARLTGARSEIKDLGIGGSFIKFENSEIKVFLFLLELVNYIQSRGLD